MRKISFKKVLFGLAVSLVLAMAIGSFAIGDNQTPANPQMETSGAVNAPDSGAFTVTATDGETVLTDNDYSYSGGILTIKSATPMTIKNTNTGSTTDRIVIGPGSLQQGDTVSLTLAGVNISTGNGAAFEIKDDATFNVNITLADGSENTLTATSVGYAGLQKNGDSGVGMLTISGTGKLTANGGSGGAGIGGGNAKNGSNITISGGVVTATGGTNAAGIGGGDSRSGSNITISGGTVTATGGTNAAGIGGGRNGSGSNITISGGSITATGGYTGAGIGGGRNVSGSNNSIDGDNVVVIAQSGDASKAALDGFGSTIGKGLIFTKQGSSGSWNYTMYNSVEISGDVEIPTSFTVPNGFTIKNKANLTFAGGANITCTGTGKVETLLKYDPQGGSFSGLDDSYQLYQDSSGTGKSYTNLPTEVTNATFNGWNKKADGTGAKLSESTVDLNLHQAYADMDYTVTFDSQGGSAVPSVSPIKYKSKVTKPTDPTREGYTFDTWYKEESCTNKWDFDKDTVQGDTTLYAGWTGKEKYNITINQLENGSVTSDKAQAAENETVTLTATPEEGYELQTGSLSVKAGTTDVAFIDKGDGKYTFTMPGAAVQVSAVFEGTSHEVTIDQPEHGTVTVNPEKPKTGDEVTITLKPEEGYKPGGAPVVKDEDGNEIELTPTGNPNEYKFTMPNSNLTIDVNFVPDSTPTPPGPEPTPDPSVDPDGDDGSGSSSKTSDPFMGGMALALLGVATTGAVLVRKRK